MNWTLETKQQQPTLPTATSAIKHTRARSNQNDKGQINRDLETVNLHIVYMTDKLITQMILLVF